MVKDKYHMISPTSGTWSTKQTSKQNIPRAIEIKNKGTVTRGEMGGDNGGKRVKDFQEQLYLYILKRKYNYTYLTVEAYLKYIFPN